MNFVLCLYGIRKMWFYKIDIMLAYRKKRHTEQQHLRDIFGWSRNIKYFGLGIQSPIMRQKAVHISRNDYFQILFDTLGRIRSAFRRKTLLEGVG